jgi:hypothetical protein
LNKKKITDENQRLLEVLQVLHEDGEEGANKNKIQEALKGMYNLDWNLYNLKNNPLYANNENVKALIESLINLEANALLSLSKDKPGSKEFFENIIMDIRTKIGNVNMLLRDEQAINLDQQTYDASQRAEALREKDIQRRVDEEKLRRKTNLNGGGDPLYVKYLKYKTKYMKLRSTLDHVTD